MPPPLCFCRTVRRDTRKTNFPNKSPLGSSWAREQTTETPSTEATPEHHRGCFNAPAQTRHTGPRSGTQGTGALPPQPSLTPSYRTPIRYPGDGRGYPHNPHSPPPTPPSYRPSLVTPDPLPRRTALRCGTHGGVRAAGRTFDYGPARRKRVPPTSAPHHGYRFSPVRRGGGHHVFRPRIGVRGDVLSPVKRGG